MSALSDLDDIVLRSVVNPPLTTKGSRLSYSELDNHAVKLYDAVQSIVSGANVTDYDNSKTYDKFSTDIRDRYVGYNNRIWEAAYVGSPSTFSGQTPAEGIYWTQVTLAELMPNILPLARLADELTSTNQPLATYVNNSIIASADVLTSNATPINLSVPRQSGQTILPIAATVGIDSITTPYNTNTTLAVRYVGADTDLFTLDCLGRTDSNAVQMEKNFTVGAGQSQILSNTDLEVYTKAGNPIGGNGNVSVGLIYVTQ